MYIFTAKQREIDLSSFHLEIDIQIEFHDFHDVGQSTMENSFDCDKSQLFFFNYFATNNR